MAERMSSDSVNPQGARAAVSPVPEPRGLMPPLIALLLEMGHVACKRPHGLDLTRVDTGLNVFVTLAPHSCTQAKYRPRQVHQAQLLPVVMHVYKYGFHTCKILQFIFAYVTP